MRHVLEKGVVYSVEMVIRTKQMAAFDEDAKHRFESEMVAHSKEFSPRLCEVIGDEQVYVAVRSAIQKAQGYGFTLRGPIRLFIEMMYLCGSAFDTDPQYAPVGAILREPGDQMQRAERIHEGALEYFEQVSGPDNVNAYRALEGLSKFVREPIPFSSNDFEAGMLREMHRLFPERASYIGDVGLRAVVQEGRGEAQKYSFTTIRSQTLIVTLMYSFGHGCTNDPIYPWISRTLIDEKITDPTARAERLEKKAQTWLDRVLANRREGRQM